MRSLRTRLCDLLGIEYPIVPLTTLLFDIAPTDALTFALVAVLLDAVSIVASYFPARRALRVDPAVALRPE